jgi:alpha-tubulin suppressor-like RCC1 family protein
MSISYCHCNTCYKSSLQIVAGSYCTYAVRFDGTVSSVGEGSYGRLGHGGSESETKMRTISALQGTLYPTSYLHCVLCHM